MADQHLFVKVIPEVAMKVARVCINHEKLVYVIQANKRLHYKKGTSRIAYIGTTKKGLNRIATSVAEKADKILEYHGIRDLDVRIVRCDPRQRVKTWEKLERALLLCFKQQYGAIPRLNSQGKNMVKGDEFEYFRRQRIQNILEKLS